MLSAFLRSACGARRSTQLLQYYTLYVFPNASASSSVPHCPTSAAAARSSQPAPKKVLPGMQVEYASPLEGRTRAVAARARAGRPLSLAAVL